MVSSFYRVYRDLYHKKYSLLAFPIGFLSKNATKLESDPLYELIRKLSSNEVQDDEVISTPNTINDDKEFKNIPGYYLVSDGTKAQLLNYDGNCWCKTKINNEDGYL